MAQADAVNILKQNLFAQTLRAKMGRVQNADVNFSAHLLHLLRHQEKAAQAPLLVLVIEATN